MAKRVFAVKKTLGGSLQYRKWSDWKEGDSITGKFLEQTTDSYEKPNYRVLVLDADIPGDQDYATSLIGKTFVFNSNGGLDSHMEKVEVGECICVKYSGKAKLTKGKYAGKDFHNVTTEVVDIPESEQRDILASVSKSGAKEGPENGL